jgi:hypothetical protein
LGPERPRGPGCSSSMDFLSLCPWVRPRPPLFPILQRILVVGTLSLALIAGHDWLSWHSGQSDPGLTLGHFCLGCHLAWLPESEALNQDFCGLHWLCGSRKAGSHPVCCLFGLHRLLSPGIFRALEDQAAFVPSQIPFQKALLHLFLLCSVQTQGPVLQAWAP